MKTLYFQQISDSRFNGNIDTELSKRMSKIRHALNIPGVELTTNTFRHLSWDDGTQQVRVDCYVTKDRSITWKHIYGLINRINAVPYKFI